MGQLRDISTGDINKVCEYARQNNLDDFQIDEMLVNNNFSDKAIKKVLDIFSGKLQQETRNNDQQRYKILSFSNYLDHDKTREDNVDKLKPQEIEKEPEPQIEKKKKRISNTSPFYAENGKYTGKLQRMYINGKSDGWYVSPERMALGDLNLIQKMFLQQAINWHESKDGCTSTDLRFGYHFGVEELTARDIIYRGLFKKGYLRNEAKRGKARKLVPIEKRLPILSEDQKNLYRFFVCREVALLGGLSYMEKYVLGTIVAIIKKSGKPFKAGNEFLMRKFGIGREWIRKILRKLKKLGFIKVYLKRRYNVEKKEWETLRRITMDFPRICDCQVNNLIKEEYAEIQKTNSLAKKAVEVGAA